MPTLLVSLCLLLARAQASTDALLTGTWEGRLAGESSELPPEGLPITLVLEPRGADGVLARLTVSGAAAAPVTVEFDEGSGALEFRCDLGGVQVALALVVDGEHLSGTVAGLGQEVRLEAQRSARTLPETEPQAARRVPELSTLTPEDWRVDLEALATELPRRHGNAFHALSKEAWDAAVRALAQRLPQLTAPQSALALAQLVARVGDAHTELALAGRPFDTFVPVNFAWFSDGIFVTAVDARFGDCLALRVRAIGARPVEDVVAAVGTTFALENDSWLRAHALGRLQQPALLAALGVLESDEGLPLVLEEPGGGEQRVTVTAASAVSWLFAPDPQLIELPLARRLGRVAYAFETLPEAHAVYLAYNRCAEDPARPMQAFMEQLSAALDAPGIERLVIDLRANSGGNSAVLSRFVPALGERLGGGRLRVLIGPETYSSGMMNAQQLRDAGARLYGEPTGGRPNSWGEVRSFVLPRSGLTVYHSTRLFRMLPGDPPAVVPDRSVTTSSEDWFSGRDPVLERALADE